MATPSNTKLDTPHTATNSARAPRVILTIPRRGEERGKRETERDRPGEANQSEKERGVQSMRE